MAATVPFALIKLCVLFVLGQAVYVLKRAAFAVRSAVNPARSRSDFLYRNWDVLVIRGAVAQLLFWTWVTHPGLLNLASQYLPGSYHPNLEIPAYPVIAFGLGLAIDVVLDWLAEKIPILRSQIPQPSSNGTKPPEGGTP